VSVELLKPQGGGVNWLPAGMHLGWRLRWCTNRQAQVAGLPDAVHRHSPGGCCCCAATLVLSHTRTDLSCCNRTPTCRACVPLFSDGTEAMLPSMLLSPLLGFADIDSPDSPHSLASGCDAMVSGSHKHDVAAVCTSLSRLCCGVHQPCTLSLGFARLA
jgi:hypothetical protein